MNGALCQLFIHDLKFGSTGLKLRYQSPWYDTRHSSSRNGVTVCKPDTNTVVVENRLGKVNLLRQELDWTVTSPPLVPHRLPRTGDSTF